MPRKQSDESLKTSGELFITQFLIATAVVIVSAFLLHLVRRFYTYAEYMQPIQTASGYAALALLAAGAVLALIAVLTGSRRLFAVGGLVLTLAAAACCIYAYFTAGALMAIALVIGAGALYVAEKIYNAEFLVLAGICFLAGVAFFGISRNIGGTVWNQYTAPLFIALAAVLLIGVLTALLAAGRDGILALGRLRLTMWQNKSCMIVQIVICLVLAALLGLIFLLGATFAWYCMLVAGLTIFALAVWFTIKLM